MDWRPSVAYEQTRGDTVSQALRNQWGSLVPPAHVRRLLAQRFAELGDLAIRTGTDSRFGLLALRALRRPVVACAVVLGLILLLALPAMRLDMGPPTPLVMSADQKQRADYETFAHTLGQGWTSPYQVVVASRHGPITDRRTLAALGDFQRRLSARRDVDAVLGPGEIAQRTSGFGDVSAQLAKANGELPESADAIVLAQLASATIHTIAIRARAQVPRKELEAIVNGALDVMCGPAK